MNFIEYMEIGIGFLKTASEPFYISEENSQEILKNVVRINLFFSMEDHFSITIDLQEARWFLRQTGYG